MAAVSSSPSGFSYAQAAKGRSTAATAQTPANKATSGAVTPATSAFSELAPSTNWADDVEASVGEKVAEAHQPAEELSRSAHVKDNAVDRAKLEDKTERATSGVSSPDLAASSSTTTNNDDSSTAPTNGSSETTWETKSQVSEPAWIADRKERQSSSQNSDSTVKGGKKSKESSAPPPKPVVLREAAPPSTNPWARRLEENKARFAAQQPALKPAAAAPVTEANGLKENQRPRTDSRRKANSVAGLPRNGESSFSPVGKPSGAQGKRANDVRINQSSSKPATSEASSAGPSRQSLQTRSSLPNVATAPPSVKDEVSWPTPETSQDKERKEAPEKESPEKHVEDGTPTTQPRKKPEWQTMVVTPNIIFETQNIRGRDAPRGAPSGERGGRGGMRGRGGYRGGANGVNGVERSTGGRLNNSQSDAENGTTAVRRGRSDTADRDAMPPPAKPNRAFSESSRHDEPTQTEPERITTDQNVTEDRPSGHAALFERKLSQDRKLEAQSNVPRTASPEKFDGETLNAKDEEHLPEPIPRRNSVGTQTHENGERAGDGAFDGQSTKVVPSETRKESRSFENGFKEVTFNASARGSGKRGGRGRGGSREFVNGHQANHAYANGDFASFGVPPSPSFAGARGNHQYPYPQQGRGGWSRGNPRPQPIPMEGYYGRYGNSYAQSQLPPMQTYMPGMYEYGYPISAIPYTPYVEHQYLMDMVSTQLEYYFSLDNLLKDMFLRQNMDSQGFVYLDVIAGFNRLKQLTQDKDLLKAVCLNSETIDIRVGEDGKERLRRREGWDQFLLPTDQREQGAQNEGPQQLQRPEKPQLQIFGPAANRGPQSAAPPGMAQRFDRRSYDYAMMHGIPPQYMGYPPVSEGAYAEMNGDDTRGRAAKSPIHDNETSPVQQSLSDDKDAEPDAFPDSQLTTLTVVVKPYRPHAPFHSAASRTFSNGSIDSRSIFGEMEKSSESQASSVTNGETIVNGGDGSTSRSRHASPSTARSHERPAGPDVSVFWMKDESEKPSDPPNHVSLEPYVQLRLKALDQRSHAATGTCPYDLDVLYQFWCHFLIRNFNSRMYAEFKYYASQDGKERHNFNGLQNLVKFYDQALLSHQCIRDRLVKDYVELVNTEPAKLDGAAFKQLRSAWRNGALNLKNRKKLADIVDDSLKERLES